jgi:hypothetical protein
MKPQVAIARVWYVGGSVVFALVTVALTRAQGGLRDAAFLVQVLAPTMLVACYASSVLISSDRVAGVRDWVLAGVLVPIGALIGFLAPLALARPQGLGSLGVPMLVIGSIVVVPAGVVGHLVIRAIVAQRFFSQRPK